MKVAIYARVSSDRQAEKELSIPAQVKAIQQYCQERGYTIVSEFIEKGKSAKTDDREEFQKMIALAKRSNRSFDSILVHKFDRFSRKRDDHVIYKALLAQVGVKVISVTEQTDNETPQDKLLEGMLEVMSEFFNANLATEVRKGMTQNAKQGYNNGGTPPYGYRTEHIALGSHKTKAVWVLGPREEIDIIRWIYNQYAYENAGYKKISSMLNEKGVPTQKGGQWSASTIRAIIFNESYIGRKVWNKQDYQVKGKKWKDRSEWVITENAHPSIITEELFNLCQERAKARNNGGGETHKPFHTKSHSPFWLRGFFTCDKCGSRMVGNSTSARKKGGGQRYYSCGGYQRKGKEFCPYVGWRKEHVELAISSKIKTTLLRLSMDNQLQEEIERFSNEKNKYIIQSATALDNEIIFLVKRIELMEQDMINGRGKPYYTDIIQEMKAELTDKEKELTILNSSILQNNVPDSYIDTVRYDIQTILVLMESEVFDPQLLNQVLTKYVANVFVQRGTKIIHIKLQFKSEEAILFDKTIAVQLI